MLPSNQVYISTEEAVNALSLNKCRFWKIYPAGMDSPLYSFNNFSGNDLQELKLEKSVAELTDRINRLPAGQYRMDMSNSTNMAGSHTFYFAKGQAQALAQVSGVPAPAAVPAMDPLAQMQQMFQLMILMKQAMGGDSSSEVAELKAEVVRLQAESKASAEIAELRAEIGKLSDGAGKHKFWENAIEKGMGMYERKLALEALAARSAEQAGAISGPANPAQPPAPQQAQPTELQYRLGMAVKTLAEKIGPDRTLEALEFLANQPVDQLDTFLTLMKGFG
jgi:hypothetical protein